MRTRLALLAAACLLPGAAAPALPTLQSAMECTAGRQPTLDLIGTLPILRDERSPTGEGTQRYYAPLPGQKVFGMAPEELALTVTNIQGREFILLSTDVTRPYAEVEAIVLAATGQTACLRRTPAPANTCIVYQRKQDVGKLRLMVRDFGDMVMIGCGYSPGQL